MFMLRSESDKYSFHETLHLDFISQFTSDIRHITSEQNIAADALLRVLITCHHLRISIFNN